MDMGLDWNLNLRRDPLYVCVCVCVRVCMRLSIGLLVDRFIVYWLVDSSLIDWVVGVISW